MLADASFVVLLFYKYISIENPELVRKEQQAFAQSLGLRGRVLIAKEGINATLCGFREGCDAYIKMMCESPLFHDVDFKESKSAFLCFEKLKVKVKDSILNLGDTCVIGKPQEHITPEELHSLLQNRPDDLVLLDARNDYESCIGAFEGAIVPPIKRFRDIPEWLSENAELFFNKDVIMYCTGGIRCELSSAILASVAQAKRVRQLLGGIHRYVEKFPNGFFKGSNYVFDDRITMQINSCVISACALCIESCDLYNNCLNALCNKHYICCDGCFEKLAGCCSEACVLLIKAGAVPARPRIMFRRQHD